MAHEDDSFLEKVILFLFVLVGLILIFTQYQLYGILQSYWTYLAIILIVALIGLTAWLLIQKPAQRRSETAKHESKSLTFMEKLTYGMTATVALLVLFSQIQLSQASALMGTQGGLTLKTFSSKTPVLTGDPTQDAMAVVIPRGTPFYGEALGVSFEDPIRSLEIIAQLDPAYGRNKVQLTAEERDRYIKIGTTRSIGCEYCCGADTSVTNDGRPTCGCKHSWAIRGLAAYLVKNYPDLSDEEIIRELAKWKSLFFPKQMIQKYIQETQTGQYTPDIASLLLDVDEEKLKEMKAAVASSGNSQNSNTAANINDLPSMVGGC